MKTLTALFIIAFAFFTDLSAAFAAPGNFDSCVNPKGEVKANYENGNHGIAGKPGSFEGKDTVYINSENTLTQCFCATDGSGIQTNWWKIPVLTPSELKSYEAQGWIYIPNGALWGLDNAPYLAKNSDFSCKNSNSNSNNSSSSNSSGGTSNSGSSSSGSNGISNAGGGVGQVLGLASTGNTLFVIGVALTSGISLLLSLILKKRARKFSK